MMDYFLLTLLFAVPAAVVLGRAGHALACAWSRMGQGDGGSRE